MAFGESLNQVRRRDNWVYGSTPLVLPMQTVSGELRSNMGWWCQFLRILQIEQLLKSRWCAEASLSKDCLRDPPESDSGRRWRTPAGVCLLEDHKRFALTLTMKSRVLF